MRNISIVSGPIVNLGFRFTDDDLIRYGDWAEVKSVDPEHLENYYIIPSLATGSDYAGNSVTVANYECLVEDFLHLDGFHKVWGGFFTYAVAIRLDVLVSNDELWETFERLADYPVISDEKLSEVELKAETEAWESWAKSDYRYALIDKAGEAEQVIEIIENLDDDALYRLFAEGCNKANEYWINEVGNSAWIEVERVAEFTDLSEMGIENA